MAPTTSPAPTTTPLALVYARVSTDAQAEGALSIDAQVATLTAEAQRRGWEVEVIVEVASGKDLTGRPLLREALARLDQGAAQVLLAARLDRIARRTADALAIVERADRYGWQVVSLGEAGIDTTTPAGRFAVTIVAAAAALERDLIAARTSEALAAKRARGERVGRPVEMPAEIRARIAADHAAGVSLSAIARNLTAEGVPTARGGVWHAATVRKVLASIRLEEDLAEARRLAEVAR